jgi:CDP-glucose 4,6-dehydratase
VTGASGMVGTNLCDWLIDLGAEVLALQHERDVKFCSQKVIGDIRGVQWASRVKAFSPEIVFHLAAQPLVEKAQLAPTYTTEVNVLGTVNLVSVLLELDNFPKLVVAETDKIYGRHPRSELPYTEETSLLGMEQIYEATKLCEAVLLRAFATSYQLPITSIRCGNIYGPHDHNHSRLIPGTIACIENGNIVQLRSNGQMTRDYLYVGDVVDAYIRAAEYRNTGMYQVFNIGTNRPVRTLDMVQAIADLYGRGSVDIYVGASPDADNEIHYQTLDFSRAEELLGWTPTTNLRDGLWATIEWWREEYGTASNK